MKAFPIRLTRVLLWAAAALLPAEGLAAAQVNLPGNVVGGDVMLSNGELLKADLRTGYLWLVSEGGSVGAGLVASGGVGLGGPSAAAGGLVLFGCSHAIGCDSISLEAKAYRPALLSPWEHTSRLGAEVGVGIYLFRFTGAVYRRFVGDSALAASVGAGLQLLL